ncbi:uncharacterized protein LOC127803253 [Diospyros lotus]|uniref:uncharacterized protein LOC127803253 n=1 Tax=Diospyros lotus TaxID=55363 RepID=UPI002257DB84|nr:uncharacterized protein LOC127803253 [Diospyros lotus]XP_052195313.1 uncharacterized protein LOC127803253 [Diospyros lotus]
MGNCQAAEAATVVIQHPGNKVERIYWSVSAHEIMNANPGHYVALVVNSPTVKLDNGTPARQLKLLRPDNTLLIGQVYRLISFEDVLKEFAAKKCLKLGKLLERGGIGLEKTKLCGGSNLNRSPNPENCPTIKVQHQVYRVGSSGGKGGGGGQWKPALQSIAEVGTSTAALCLPT